MLQSEPKSRTMDAVALGTACGLLSAAGYTAANVGLRSLVHCDPAWVSSVKSAPTIILMLPWLFYLSRRGIRIVPDAKILSTLAFGALVGQFGGNVAFQWSLGVVGLALAVPLTTGAMILGGAVLGRMFLHEPITWRTAVAMLVLTAAAALLSAGAEHAGAHAASSAAIEHLRWGHVAAGVAAALGSGFAYAVLGVALRRSMTSRVPVATTLFVVATVGVLGVGTYALSRIGWQGVWHTSAKDFGTMTIAGLCNTAAFVMLTVALRETSVTYVNMLSATQVAMAGIIGVALFSEPITTWLISGVVLTIIGVVSNRSQARSSPPLE